LLASWLTGAATSSGSVALKDGGVARVAADATSNQ
jgi:hypothetical protein